VKSEEKSKIKNQKSKINQSRMCMKKPYQKDSFESKSRKAMWEGKYDRREENRIKKRAGGGAPEEAVGEKKPSCIRPFFCIPRRRTNPVTGTETKK
jgi:hypothetical protein